MPPHNLEQCRKVKSAGLTYVLLASAFVWDLSGHNADKDANPVRALVDLVGCPVDALQGGLGDDIRASLRADSAQFRMAFVLL